MLFLSIITTAIIFFGLGAIIGIYLGLSAIKQEIDDFSKLSVGGYVYEVNKVTSAKELKELNNQTKSEK